MKKTILHVVCAWCKKSMGTKDGQGVEGISHTICEDCKKKFYQDNALVDIHGNTDKKLELNCSKCAWRTSEDACRMCTRGANKCGSPK